MYGHECRVNTDKLRRDADRIQAIQMEQYSIARLRDYQDKDLARGALQE